MDKSKKADYFKNFLLDLLTKVKILKDENKKIKINIHASDFQFANTNKI